MKCSLDISHFLEEISSLSHSIAFLYFFALIAKEGFLISPWYSLELCTQMYFYLLCEYPSLTKFRLKLKKVGKTARPFRYDLNQIPYDYTVVVKNRFKGLDLIDIVPVELWNEVRDIVQETGIKTIPMEKKCKKQNGYLGRPYK